MFQMCQLALKIRPQTGAYCCFHSTKNVIFRTLLDSFQPFCSNITVANKRTQAIAFYEKFLIIQTKGFMNKTTTGLGKFSPKCDHRLRYSPPKLTQRHITMFLPTKDFMGWVKPIGLDIRISLSDVSADFWKAPNCYIKQNII